MCTPSCIAMSKMYVVASFEDVCRVEIRSEYKGDKTLDDLDDTAFDIALISPSGAESVLHICGGNGGAYGACVQVQTKDA